MMMSRDDQIGQLFMIGFDGTTVSSDLASFIREYKPGGVILFSSNLESVEQIVELTKRSSGLQSPFAAPDLDRSGRRTGLTVAERLYDFSAVRGVGTVQLL